MKPYFLKAAFGAFIFTHTFSAFAQVAGVKFIVHTPTMQGDSGVYMAGSFNYWHAKDSLYRMNKIDNNVYAITIPVFASKNYEYKYTLGSWDRVEVALNDSDINNRKFISSVGQSITDTVVKWRQPKNSTTDSSEQLKKIASMKDSLMMKMKPEIEALMGLLKSYAQNMLQDKPDPAAHSRLDEQALHNIANIYKGITQLLWNICATLSPEQKQQVSKAISQPDKGDFLNSFLGAVNNAVK
jgi:hypothetical protein